MLQGIVAGDSDKSKQLLAALREPNETCLGVSSGEPRGRGVGRVQAAKMLHSLAHSPAGKSGLLTDLTDCALFVEGIGADKVSDITTNIIRRHLIEYTKQQFELLGLKIESRVPTGLLWETGQGRWSTEDYDFIPVVNGKKILLVPKKYVRWRGSLQQSAQKYYNNFVTNYIRDEQLRTGGRLVEVVKYKTRPDKEVVYKERVKEEYPLTKDFLAKFSVDHPDVYRKFRKSLSDNVPPSLRRVVEISGAEFNQEQFDAGLIAALSDLPTGRRKASEYHYLMSGILTYIFYPDLINPVIEWSIDQGRKRIDIGFSNSAEDGFFKDRKDDPFCMAREIIFECKNYEADIANPEIDQLAGRFDHRRGRFGVILCRSVSNSELALERCRDVYKSNNGMIMILTDDDVISILKQRLFSRRKFVQNLLRGRLRQIAS